MEMKVTETTTTRRQFLEGSAAVAGAAALGAASLPKAQAQAAKATKRPNILFLFTEGQRADALSLHGKNKFAMTPNMDRIGKEGVVFSNAFVTNALCGPSRTVALTGLYSHTTGVLGNSVKDPLPKSTPIITDVLHDAGYEVAMVGKVHTPFGFRDRYWDYYCGFNSPVTNYYHPRFFEGRKGKMGPETTVDDVYADDLFTDRALAWLKEDRGDKPFCLCLWHQTPHAPFWRPRKYLDLFNGMPVDKPATFDDDLKGYPGKPRCFAAANNKIGTTVTGDAVRSLEELTKDYYAGLRDVDDNIGRVFAYLESIGELDNTIIMFSSDHGYFMGEWRMFDKRFHHEPSSRVPMMVRYPKVFKKPGKKVDGMVLNLDIFPTLMELAGVPAPEHLEGKSMVKLATSGDPEWRKDWLYEYFEYPVGEAVRPHRMIRTDTHKYVHYFADPQEYEMYDLSKDPGELNNLAGKPEVASLQRELAARLETLRQQTHDKTTNALDQSGPGEEAPKKRRGNNNE
jgi:arylsulfatase A-like enzyme